MSGEHCESADANGPDVDFVAVTFVCFGDKFRAEVVRGSTHRVLALVVVVELGGESEVCNFDCAIAGDKEVVWLQIPVYDSVVVEIAESVHDLAENLPGFCLIEALCLSEVVANGMASAKLENDIEEVCVVKRIVKLQNVLVVQRTLDCDFAFDFVQRLLALGDVVFPNSLQGEALAGLIRNTINRSEATASQFFMAAIYNCLSIPPAS